MEFDQIKELIKLLQGTTVSEFKYETSEMSISIRTKDFQKVKEVVVQPTMMPAMGGMQMMTPTAPVAPTTPTSAGNNNEGGNEGAGNNATPEIKADGNYLEIKSPMVGTFYRSASPEKPPFVKVGDVIGPEDNVCLIEAMKLFNEVKSEVTGRVVKVLVEDASPVEYDQVLFLVEPLV
jgi:acetyl-CoA carboxylase biotin carboxyl carrier protein